MPKKNKVKPLPQPVEPEPEVHHEEPEPEVPHDEPEPEVPHDEPEPEPEPVPVKPKKLRPCERIRTPEDIERQRLHTESRRAKRAAYLATLK